MAEQTFLGEIGFRTGLLGSSANLTFAAPVADGNWDETAGTYASRIGSYFSRTGGSEGVYWNVLGTDRFAAEVNGATIYGRGQVLGSNAATIQMVVKGAAAQSVNLQEWQDNSSAVMASVSQTGVLTAARYFIGSEMSLWGVASAQDRLGSNAALQLAGNIGANVTSAPVDVGAVGAYSVILGHPTQVTAPSVATVSAIGIAGQTVPLQVWQTSAAATLSQVSILGWFGNGIAPACPVDVSLDQAVGPPFVRISSYGNATTGGFTGGSAYNGFLVRRARGTPGSPTAVQAGDIIASFGGLGYGTSAFASTHNGSMQVKAFENFTNTAWGSYLDFMTTTRLTTSLVNQVRIDDLGNLVHIYSSAAGALATSATAGFYYATSMAGTPVGVPTATYTGRVPLVIDTTANVIWAYHGGAWVAQVGSNPVNGTGVANRVTFWSGTSTLSSSANFTWTTAQLAIGVPVVADAAANVIITPTASGNKGLVIQRPSGASTGNLQEWESETGAVVGYISNIGLPHFPGATSNDSQRIGEGSAVTGARTTAVGVNAVITGENGTAIGWNARSSASGGCAIGYNTNVTVANGVAVGASASCTGTGSTVIGNQAASAFSECIVLGVAAASTASNQFIAGSNTRPMSNVYFGKGAQNVIPTAYTIHGTSPRPGTDTDVAGGGVTIAGGRGTGTGISGPVLVTVAPAGAVSGNALNNSVTVLTCSGLAAGSVIATSSAASAKTLIVRGFLSQTANLQEWQTSVSGTLAYVGAAGNIVTAASTTTIAGLNLPHGTAPSSPVNGDIWTTTTGAFAYINSITVPLSNTTVIYNSYSGSQVLTLANDTAEYTGAGGHTFTLPAANARTPNGARIWVYNSGSGNLTLAAAGADTIDTAASITLTPGQAVVAISNGGSAWRAF
jgi:hypothetical protein